MIRTRSQYPSTPATVVVPTCRGVVNVMEFDCVNACVLSWNPVAVGAAGVDVPSTTHAFPFHISHDSLKSVDGLVVGGVCSRHRTQRLSTPFTIVEGTGVIAPKSTDPEDRNASVPSPRRFAGVHAVPFQTSHCVFRSSGVCSSAGPTRRNDSTKELMPLN